MNKSKGWYYDRGHDIFHPNRVVNQFTWILYKKKHNMTLNTCPKLTVKNNKMQAKHHIIDILQKNN
jgi:hypothetical protein